MEKTAFTVDPKEAGVNVGDAGGPTETGWKIVTPNTWYFRNNLVADKALTVKGYTDTEFYMDCTKATIVCEVYKNMPFASVSDREVEILRRYLTAQQVSIRPYEYLIGNRSSDVHGMIFDARSDNALTFDEFYEHGKAFVWKDGVKQELNEQEHADIVDFCQRNNYIYTMKPFMSEMHYKMWVEGGQRYWELPGFGGFRANPDHEWYLSLGFRKLIHMMEETIERLEKELSTATGKNFVDLSYRLNDCRNSIVSTENVIIWIKKHGQVAKEMAKQEKDPRERERLDSLSNICEWVSENSPRNFWELMQLHWLSFMIHYLIEHTAQSVTFRPDQSWLKWYEKDVLIDKTCTRTFAGDLVAFYFMKYHEIGVLGSLKEYRSIGMGARDFSVLTIGGQKPDGSDATNDLTMLILDVMDGYRFHFPDVKVRWHQKFDRSNLKRVCEIMRTGMGSPSLRNDNTSIPGMMDQYQGLVSIEEARSWAVVGCNTPGVTINSRGAHMRSARTMNAMKPLEFVLYNGRDPQEDWEFVMAEETGNPADFKNFEEFYQAFLKQWTWLVRIGVGIRSIVDDYYIHAVRRPFVSMLYKRCIEEGRDVMTLKVPWLSFNNCPGWVDTMDSLAAVKYWIYDKKKYTMEQLVIALDANWEGYDEMQQDFKDAPKFGNNDEYADSIFSRATVDVINSGKKVLDLQDEPSGMMSALVVTYMYHLAGHSGALPNGRKRGEPLCDGGINPHAEFDKGGPWDRLASAIKIDQSQFKAWIYNQKFDFNTVKGDAGLEKMLDFTLSGLESGMDQLQYNLISRDILLDAKENPETYPFLAIRISGYSAYFTDLPEFVQNAVIDRVDHEL